MSNVPSDDLDDDHTDELPILLETVLPEDAREDAPPPRAEDTAQQTALYHALDEAGGSSAEVRTELAERAARASELEVQIRALSQRNDALEEELAQRDRLIGELRNQKTPPQGSTDDTSVAERRLATQVAIRDARIAELTALIERLQSSAATHTAEVDKLRAALESTHREADSLKSQLAESPPGASAEDVQALLEDKATLTAYIASRRTWWDEAQAKQTELAAKIASLQQELSVAAKRLSAAETLAAQESNRAVGLRAELVDYARRATTLERELQAARAVDARPTPSGQDGSPGMAGAPPAAAPTEAPASPSARDVAAAARAAQQQPVEGETIDTAAPAVEAVAQLEAEVEYKRQQVAAQLVELRDRDERLRAAAGELERLRRDVSALRTELDESRASAGRLERAVIDKDRALEARDARIATLQEEIRQRLSGLDKSSAGDFPLGRTERAAPVEGSAESVAAPALICLTGDAPKRFPLTRKTITIGRAPHCELQIVTHFVSREHARITLNSGRVLIEDAGSRNGVFVNSVRVDRQVLQQGDLITIGDTQFRFVESLAH